MTISSRATTPTVTASRVKFAPENELAMSAPKAGPPVTLTTRSPGSPSRAASRNPVTVSVSAKPLRSAANGNGARAASPSADCASGMGGAPCVTAAARARACSAAARSSGERGCPSARVTSRITGAESPPGNALSNSVTRADSAAAGTTTGACSAEPVSVTSPSIAPPAIVRTSAKIQDSRPETRSPMRAHIGRRISGARCMPVIFRHDARDAPGDRPPG